MPQKKSWQAYPLRFAPILKRTIWGGRRLAEKLDKPLGPETDYAESWEIVDHGEDQSVAINGPLAGQTLKEILANDAKTILGNATSPPQFPLLLKYLDCNRVLSVQVHPDDNYGARMSPPDLGKTEAWYVVESEPDSLIYAGLKEGVCREDLADAIDQGTTESLLNAFHPNAGDVVFIPAGTVHALGAGLLVAEIQQSSNTTFRLFDWNRVGSDGSTRPLHLHESLEVADFDSGPVHATKAHENHADWQELVSCEKFVLSALNQGRQSIAGDGKFHILTVPKGQATLQHGQDQHMLEQGQTILLPASLGESSVTLEPETTVLEMHHPD